MAGVIGFGALNVDKIMMVDKIPGPDEEGCVLSVQSHPGGSAANTVVGLSRLGVRTGYIGKVGNDADGGALLRDLENERVETAGVRACEGRSGVCMSLVDGTGLRSLLVDPGVNDAIALEEVSLDYVRTFELIHMTSFMCRATDLSFRTQLALAQELNVPITLDPGQLYAERGTAQLEPIIRRCRAMLPNRRELKLMTGLGPKGGARKLLGLGAEMVVVKMGMRGCYVTDGDLECRIPAFGGRGIDTTGAGDAFNAGFIWGLLKGLTLPECAAAGAKVAWFSVQKIGARAGLPSLEDLSSPHS